MHCKPLGRTGTQVSALWLGTRTFGEQNTEAQAQLDRAVAAGINFIDTAEVYPVPPEAATQGRTESYIGNWLAARGCREQVILPLRWRAPVTGSTGYMGVATDWIVAISRRPWTRACGDCAPTTWTSTSSIGRAGRPTFSANWASVPHRTIRASPRWRPWGSSATWSGLAKRGPLGFPPRLRGG